MLISSSIIEFFYSRIHFPEFIYDLYVIFVLALLCLSKLSSDWLLFTNRSKQKMGGTSVFSANVPETTILGIFRIKGGWKYLEVCVLS